MATDSTDPRSLKNGWQRALPFFCAFLFLTSCFSRPALMTYDTFDNVQVGTTVVDLKSEVGSPYAIHHKEGEIEEYEYVERINVGSSRIAENHYFLVIQNGKVVGKYMNRERPPAYNLIYQDEPNYPGYTP
jgi:hypothetical protein